MNTVGSLRLRAGVLDDYRDVLTPSALETISALAPFDTRTSRPHAVAHRAARAPSA